MRLTRPGSGSIYESHTVYSCNLCAMAMFSHRTTAFALLLWHATLSMGGYGLHDLVGFCHAPNQHLPAFPATYVPLAPTSGKPGSDEVTSVNRSSAGATNCCGTCHVRRGRSPTPLSDPSTTPRKASEDRSCTQLPELTSPTADFYLTHCPLCQWLGQLSVPLVRELPALVRDVHAPAATPSATIFTMPTWTPFSPRGPPGMPLLLSCIHPKSSVAALVAPMAG